MIVMEFADKPRGLEEDDHEIVLFSSSTSRSNGNSDSGVDTDHTVTPASLYSSALDFARLISTALSSTTDCPLNNEELVLSDYESHSSSLESENEQTNRPSKRTNAQTGTIDHDSNSSCSVDSFELSTPIHTLPHCSSLSCHSKPLIASSSSSNPIDTSCSFSLSDATRRSIKNELSTLDTKMPKIDFDRLERQLSEEVNDREMGLRTLLSEQVRRRLALEDEKSERIVSKSNFPHRFQAGLNLQVCFVNDSNDESGEDKEGSKIVPKSRSTPNLAHKPPWISNGMDLSHLCASDIRKNVIATQPSDSVERQRILEEETKTMLLKAKQAAHMQMEMERQTRTFFKSSLESIVGISLSGKFTRRKLSLFGITQLQIIVNQLLCNIEDQNRALIELLVDKDNLHMEQDSMLVDIEDMIQHRKNEHISPPAFLGVEIPGIKDKKCRGRFRIFKR